MEPANQQILSNEPFVAKYPNFLSDLECQHFIDLSEGKLKDSLVTVADKGVVSSGRTSSNTWIKHDHDSITKEVGERIAKMVGIPLENAESFQLIYYGSSQEYKNHYDSWEHNGSEKTLRCMKYGGARMITALCYLNDVVKGGETKMTKLNITVPPTKGQMLVFHNTISSSNHARHPLSEHAGLPVVEGEKYAFNLWFRECNSKMLYKEFNPSYYQSNQKTEGVVLDISKEVVKETTNEEVKETAKEVVVNEIPKEVVVNKTSKELVVNKTHKEGINLLPDSLQIGDYLPFIKINGIHFQKHVHNYCNENPFIIATMNELQNDLCQFLLNISSNFNIIVLFEKGDFDKQEKTGKILLTKDKQLKSLLKINKKPTLYIANPNRRIISIMDSDTLMKNGGISKENYLTKNAHIPYLIIEDVLDKTLLKKIIDFYYLKKEEGKLIAHQHATKDRLHVHPDRQLEIEIDHKLSRTVLCEIRKVFYFDVQYREYYKICSYDAETSGRFHAHRDTPAPYQHRKYALSLFLNDDYEGGEFVLPEYGLSVKPKANTAFVFPGINTHQVLPVTKGSRMTIITFFVNGDLKEHYKMKKHFFKDKGIINSEIYPL